MFYRYIYKITYLPTKQFYIGKRKAKENCKPEEDFAIYYFTSASSNSCIKKSFKKNRFTSNRFCKQTQKCIFR